ncbi:MAG: flagellar export protein FliJ [Candidatus Riflebacteria bacterium]|nr:flagellar export protein FliJ [Candidatus Riflebacteria bacterium]
MAFVYRFATLLRLALHEEGEVKNRLAVKDGQIAAEEAKIQKVVKEREEAFADQARDLMTGSMERIRMYPLYLQRLGKTQAFYEDELQRLRSQRQKILNDLAEKRRRRKIFEKLRERDEKRYQKKELKRDQKQMDEFAARSASHDRNKDDHPGRDE